MEFSQVSLICSGAIFAISSDRRTCDDRQVFTYVNLSTTRPVGPLRGSANSRMWQSLFFGGFLPCLALSPVVFALTWWRAGRASGWSALAGLALATVFFLVGFACLRLVMSYPASVQLAGALAIFFVQVLLLFALADVIGSTAWLNTRAFALGGLVGAIAWQAGQATIVLRSRRLIYPDVVMPGESV